MNKIIKQFAERYLRIIYPGVSRRLLDDLAERVIHAKGEDLLGQPFDTVRALVQDGFVNDIALSPAFLRQSVTHRLMYQGNHSPHELIYLIRDKAVGNNTSKDRLSQLLKDTIEHDGDLVVTREAFGGPPPSPRVEPEQVELLIVSEAGAPPDQDEIDRLLQADYPHRIVYVTVPERSAAADMEEIARDILHPNLIHNGASHFCSFVTTVITRPRSIPNPDIELEPAYDRNHLRIMRDKTVLTASSHSANDLPDDPPQRELDRWARNVTLKQIGFSASGGGASAYRFIALIRIMYSDQAYYDDKIPLPIDVFSGLSGGSLIGAYLAGNEPDFSGMSHDGLKQALARGTYFAQRMPLAMLTTKPIQEVVDQDLNHQQVGDTSVRYHAITTEMSLTEPPGTPPEAKVLVKGSLGQAVRISSSLPIGFAPTILQQKRFTDGMASAIVPTHVTIDHGADVLLACNCLPGPDATNPFSDNLIGRAVYDLTFLGRYIDMWSWIHFMVQNASHEFGHWVDAYYQFNPQSIKTFEFLKWGDAYDILLKAYLEQNQIAKKVERLQRAWERIP